MRSPFWKRSAQVERRSRGSIEGRILGNNYVRGHTRIICDAPFAVKEDKISRLASKKPANVEMLLV
jgi:hypothetical protein